MKKVRALVPVVVASAALVLSGCDLHPGAAAEVGDETISMSTVDDVAGDYCRALEKQLNGDHQVVPQNYFRTGIAATLALRSAAEQLADEYGVEPGKVYEGKVADLEQQVSVLPDDVEDAVVTIETGSAYVTDIQEGVGKAILAQQGNTSPKYSEAAKAGQQAFRKWIADHDVEFDPSLGVTIENGQISSTDDSVSYALGTSARSGAAQRPDPKYSAALPDAHRCG